MNTRQLVETKQTNDIVVNIYRKFICFDDGAVRAFEAEILHQGDVYSKWIAKDDNSLRQDINDEIRRIGRAREVDLILGALK